MTRASEAYDAGLRPGDVIVGFNGQAIDDPSQFLRMVADSKPGTTAVVKVLRGGRTLEFKLPIVSTSSTRTRSLGGLSRQSQLAERRHDGLARRVPRLEFLERAAQLHRRASACPLTTSAVL